MEVLAALVQVTDCSFVGNNAFEGGAILNDGQLLVVNSTFSGNSGSFGGTLQTRASATLTHCTISDNSGFYCGGIYNKSPSLTLNNCIITDAAQPQDVYTENAVLIFTNANLIQSFGDNGSGSSISGRCH